MGMTLEEKIAKKLEEKRKAKGESATTGSEVNVSSAETLKTSSKSGR